LIGKSVAPKPEGHIGLACQEEVAETSDGGARRDRHGDHLMAEFRQWTPPGGVSRLTGLEKGEQRDLVAVSERLDQVVIA
jgi:hypothetical protein